MTPERVGAAVVAAGQGLRAGYATPKQYTPLLGRPILAWSLQAFSAHAEISEVVAVIDPRHGDFWRPLAQLFPNVAFVAGGEQRTHSVRAGLEALAKNGCTLALIHDAARPGLSQAMISQVIAGLGDADAVAPALPVADALRRSDPQGLVVAELDRLNLHRVQTPQGVRLQQFLAAMVTQSSIASFEDELALARSAGLSARLIGGDPALHKVTWPGDFDMLERLLTPVFLPACGTGFDAHRFGPGDHVTLCGVRIAHSAGLIGHSDADAAWHALTDAILGALGQGDIGDHFPPSDPQWRGAPSLVFLAHAARLAQECGARIAHVDVTLMCERPKIKPHREAMRASTATALGLPICRVSVKATTTERMGFTGREEGLAAMATATLLLPEGGVHVS